VLDERISIATVYRTVRLLEEKGILERRDFGGGRARYEPTEHGHHYHLIDVETGKVIEFSDAEHERVMQAIAARLGFELVSLRLELFGRRLEERRDTPAGAHGRDPRTMPGAPRNAADPPDERGRVPR
jgi:Fur family ferric uptake transcriptional regulator